MDERQEVILEAKISTLEAKLNTRLYWLEAYALAEPEENVKAVLENIKRQHEEDIKRTTKEQEITLLERKISNDQAKLDMLK